MSRSPPREHYHAAPVTAKNFRLGQWKSHEPGKTCTHMRTLYNGERRQCGNERAPGLTVCRVHKRRR